MFCHNFFSFHYCSITRPNYISLNHTTKHIILCFQQKTAHNCRIKAIYNTVTTINKTYLQLVGMHFFDTIRH